MAANRKSAAETWLETLLDGRSRPASATWAAFLAVVAGGMTLVAGVVVVEALFGAAAPFGWLVAVIQVAAAVLLTAGGARLATGAGRTALVTGGTLQLLICGVYLLYALTEVRQNTTEPPATVVLMTALPVFFATVLAASVVLALRPAATEYLKRVRPEHRTRCPPGRRA